jgi:hypothetical protein
MEAEDKPDYIGAVFIHLLQPIAELCEPMLSLGSSKVASSREI